MKIEYTLLLLFLIALSNITYGGIKTIEGKVLDNKQQALQYVSIGIINKTYGTISNESGYFKIQINENQLAYNDSLRFSMIGFESRLFSVKEMFDNRFSTIILIEKIESIPEVVITSRRLETIENGTTINLFPIYVQLAISEIPNQNLGSEIGRSFSINHKNTIIEKLKFYIAQNNYDSVTFRVNIYSVKHNKPYKNILTQNIFVQVINGKTEWISVNLKPYNIYINNDIIVSLEWVEKSEKGNTLVFPLARPSAATHYYKYGSQNK
ncbi:MAG: hypothetical protein A2W99_12555 [Bacteroidetes bacterium GWF2_33_16]|nr:MAG: hypothetical protein A2X00_01720 [Bacteroidetes bacterium GWE2_32_14]OFY06521.1 MAG: hypothetical protein A2W99_12555 [Bacteroidetes bacterium GWF2_33_16]